MGTLDQESLLASDVSKLLGQQYRDPLTPAAVRWSADRGKIASTRTAGGVRIFRRQDVEKFARERASRK
jgi:hypothetical protein